MLGERVVDTREIVQTSTGYFQPPSATLGILTVGPAVFMTRYYSIQGITCVRAELSGFYATKQHNVVCLYILVDDNLALPTTNPYGPHPAPKYYWSGPTAGFIQSLITVPYPKFFMRTLTATEFPEIELEFDEEIL